MRTLFAAVLLALSLNCHSAIIIEANNNIDGAVLDFDNTNYVSSSGGFNLDFSAFFPGIPAPVDGAADPWQGVNPFSYFTGNMYVRWDMVIDMSQSTFTNPVGVEFIRSGAGARLLNIIDSNFSGTRTIYTEFPISAFSDTVFNGYFTDGMSLAGVWFGQGLNVDGVPTLSEMLGSRIVFGQGNRIVFGSSLEAIGVNEPPLIAILGLGFLALAYRRYRRN